MATLVYSDVNGTDRSFSLGAEPILVGRAPECAIRSDDPRVSRTHARFYLDQGALWVEDLGSANGIYVGPQKVQRAPVPTGEIVLVGSLMIRLLPVSGTLPPPVGLHGTLATWLEMERKARVGVEDERDAFVKRVGQLFEEMKALREAQAAHEAEATELRIELDKLQRKSSTDLEVVRLDLAKAREAKMIAETTAGISTAERLVESDKLIAGLRSEISQLQSSSTTTKDDSAEKELSHQLAEATLRAEKAEKDLATAQIRAQGAERNLFGANTATATAEGRANELEGKVAELAAARGHVDADLAAAREQIKAFEARASTMSPSAKLDAAEARATKLATDLAEAMAQLDTRRDRINELETAVADARAAKLASVEAEKKVQATLAEAQTKARAEFAAAQTRITELEARLRDAGSVEAEIAAARKTREESREQAALADKRMTEALTRAEEQDKRASAADTMAKAMAKDVAEALRRAVEADAKARAVSRELAGAHRKAEEAEQRALVVTEAEARAAAAEQALAEAQAQITAQLTELEQTLTAKSEQLQQELRSKLEATQRELVAERGSAMALVTYKATIERELHELRTNSSGSGARATEAETKLAQAEVQIEALEERTQDLESNLAVEQTAAATVLEEQRARVQKLEEQLAEAKASSKTASKTAAGLEKRVDATETELANVKQLRASAEAELALARRELEAMAELRELAASAEQRAVAAEARIDGFDAKAEAADLAIGRASGLQRQLDEALQKLSWLESENEQRDSPDTAAKLAELHAQLDTVENRARAAEQQARDSDAHAREYADRIRDAAKRSAELEAVTLAAQSAAQEADARVQAALAQVDDLEGQAADAQSQVRELESKVRATEQRSAEVEARSKDIEARAKEAAERIVDAERRARDAQNQLAEMSMMLSAAEAQITDVRANANASANASANTAGLERQLAAAQQRITELKREVDAAENVRQFAANTEREIAQLERELREQKQKAAQLLLERDTLEGQLRDLREDDETAHRAPVAGRAPSVSDAPQVDVSRYTQLVARAAELEQKNQKLEKDQAQFRRALSEAEARVEAQQRANEDEPTNTGVGLPVAFAENLNILEESIDSLKANMRAASDETAMMDPTESVSAVSAAVSAAAEHVERARDALRILNSLVPKP